MFKHSFASAVATTVLIGGALLFIGVQPSVGANLHHKRTHWSSVRTQTEITSFSSSSSRYQTGTNHHFR